MASVTNPSWRAGVNLRGFINPSHAGFYGQENANFWHPPGVYPCMYVHKFICMHACEKNARTYVRVHIYTHHVRGFMSRKTRISGIRRVCIHVCMYISSYVCVHVNYNARAHVCCEFLSFYVT